MAERFKAAVLKTVDPKGPGVRIPLSPLRPITKDVKSSQILLFAGFFVLGLCQKIPKHIKISVRDSVSGKMNKKNHSLN